MEASPVSLTSDGDVLSDGPLALQAPDPDSAQAAWEQKVAPLRSGLLGIADTLLVSMRYTMQPQQVNYLCSGLSTFKGSE
jgi:hypothetical protein